MEWIRVFNSSEEAEKRIPAGNIATIVIRDQRISLAHTFKGWYGIQEACPHRGESLTGGTINYLNEIICPWHNQRFSLSDGRECEGRSTDAEIFPVRITDKGLFIGIK